MPWSGKSFAQRHNKALHGAVANKAAAQANAMIREGVDEGTAIATANKHAAKSRATSRYAEGGAVKAGGEARPVPGENNQGLKDTFSGARKKDGGGTEGSGKQADIPQKVKGGRVTHMAHRRRVNFGAGQQPPAGGLAGVAQSPPGGDQGAYPGAVAAGAASGAGAAGGGAPGMKRGGEIRHVSGKPIGKDDGIIAAQRGEFVVRRSAAQKLGEKALNEINKGHLPRSKATDRYRKAS